MTENLAEMPVDELINRVMDSDDPAVRDAALARIDASSAAVKRKLDAGVSPSDYKRLDSVRNGLAVARHVVDRAWTQARTQHEKGN
jgi:hypothetical protein